MSVFTAMLNYAFANANGHTSYISDDTFAFTGTWNSAGTYAPPLDVVNYDNGKFIVLVQNYNTPPLGSSSWSELVLRGTISPTDPFDIAQTALTTANAASVLSLAAAGTATQALDLAGDALVIAMAGTNLAQAAKTVTFTNLDSAGSVQIAPHGLDHTPLILSTMLVCGTNDFYTGMNAGQQVELNALFDSVNVIEAMSVGCDGTNIYFSFPNWDTDKCFLNWNGVPSGPSIFNFSVEVKFV